MLRSNGVLRKLQGVIVKTENFRRKVKISLKMMDSYLITNPNISQWSQVLRYNIYIYILFGEDARTLLKYENTTTTYDILV